MEGLPNDDVPNLLNVGQIPSNTAAMIDTDILEPIVFSDDFIRFQLVNKGFLNPYSRITFQLDNLSASAVDLVRGTLPLGVGVHSLIRRATLKIGTKTICEIDDFNHWSAYKSMFLTNETNKEREQYLSGRQISHDQFYSGARSTATHFPNNQEFCSHIGLDNGKEYVMPTAPAAGAANVVGNLLAHDFQLVSNKGVFSITLEDLFPVLLKTAFPLYMLNSDMPVQIELTLASGTDGSRVSVNGGASKNVPITINRNECRLIADYTTYDGAVMEAYAKKNSSLQFTYMDYRLTKQSLSDTEATNQIRNVGGAGRIVPRMFVVISVNACGVDGADGFKSVLNKYTAQSCEVDGNSGASTYGQLTANIKKNDAFIYPIDRSNTALHFQSVKDTEGMLPFVSRSEYSGQGGRMTTSTYESLSQSTGLQSKFFWTAYRMPDAQRVNSRGLELHSKMNQLPTEAMQYTSRCWIEIVKVATLVDGVFSCYYA